MTRRDPNGELTLELSPRFRLGVVENLTVSRLADRAGISPDTVRYYERIGLLAPPSRSSSGYRVYDESAVERLLFIRGAQRFGLRLGSIAELLDIRERGLCPCGHTRQLLQTRLADIDEEIEALSRLRADLERIVESEPRNARSGSGQCHPDLIQIQSRSAQ